MNTSIMNDIANKTFGVRLEITFNMQQIDKMIFKVESKPITLSVKLDNGWMNCNEIMRLTQFNPILGAKSLD